MPDIQFTYILSNFKYAIYNIDIANNEIVKFIKVL